MFVASYQNTMRNAKFSFRDSETVRSIEQIREAKRIEAVEQRRALAAEAERRRKAAARKATEIILKGRAAARAFNGVDMEAERFQRICARLCKVFGLTMTDIKGDRRSVHISMCRQAIMYWSIRRTGYSYPQVGRFLGNRDHTTLIHGVRVYPDKRAKMGRNLRAAR